MNKKHCPDCRNRSIRRGFTMMELLTVLAVLAILAMVAVPSLYEAMPYYRVRLEAFNAASVMRQARMKAANTQRPTRVVLDCRDHYGNKKQPCFFRTHAATFVNGVFEDWVEIPGTRHDFYPGVGVRYLEDSQYKKPEDVAIWAVFFPSSRVHSYFDTLSSKSPFELLFAYDDFDDLERAAWRLTLNSSSGRTVLEKKNP